MSETKRVYYAYTYWDPIKRKGVLGGAASGRALDEVMCRLLSDGVDMKSVTIECSYVKLNATQPGREWKRNE